ncbi:hypothetical protein MICA_2345 [Micavibrio aeruginosavorus ARL-13]|uniref:Uncharacterized protein n=1 Tax=Micavibrio aeruginosavorus (strain ARL-13) TaxID=856793 RepID=G2KMF4_MICAA|nr:hypothetical protein MICA_2345 [Micavibrio aeruginosavorus ARL-13]
MRERAFFFVGAVDLCAGCAILLQNAGVKGCKTKGFGIVLMIFNFS